MAVFTYIRIDPSRICPGPVTATSRTWQSRVLPNLTVTESWPSRVLPMSNYVFQLFRSANDLLKMSICDSNRGYARNVGRNIKQVNIFRTGNDMIHVSAWCRSFDLGQRYPARTSWLLKIFSGKTNLSSLLFTLTVLLDYTKVILKRQNCQHVQACQRTSKKGFKFKYVFIP